MTTNNEGGNPMQKQEPKMEIDTFMGERFPILGDDILATLVLVATRGRVLVGSFGNDHQYIRVEWKSEYEKEATRFLDGLKKPWVPVAGQPLAVEALVPKYSASQTIRAAYGALRVERDPHARWNINAPDWALPEKLQEVSISIVYTLPIPAVTDPSFSRLTGRANKVREDLSHMESELRHLALKVARGRLLSRAMEERISAMVKANGQVREGIHSLGKLRAYIPTDGVGQVIAIASLSDDILAEIEQRLGIVSPTAPTFGWGSNRDRAQAICAREDSDLFEALHDCLSDEKARELARMLGYRITPDDAPKGKWCRVIVGYR